MPDDSTNHRLPPPAPLVPRSLGGWLRPLIKAVVAPLAVTAVSSCTRFTSTRL